MKIIVISDTHIPKKAKTLPHQVITALQQCDLIIHAGDWQTVEFYHELIQYGEVKGVIGNVDSDELTAFLPEKQIIDIKGSRIGSFMVMGNAGRRRGV